MDTLDRIQEDAHYLNRRCGEIVSELDQLNIGKVKNMMADLMQRLDGFYGEIAKLIREGK